jgi:hypothetical protein
LSEFLSKTHFLASFFSESSKTSNLTSARFPGGWRIRVLNKNRFLFRRIRLGVTCLGGFDWGFLVLEDSEKNRNSLACLRNAGSYLALTGVLYVFKTSTSRRTIA